MLVAPISMPSSERSPRAVSNRHSVPVSSKQAMVAWLAAGFLAIATIPVARGGATLGATLPFWLVVAPAINLLWIERRRGMRSLAAFAQRCKAKRASPRNVRRQRAPRALACSAARS